MEKHDYETEIRNNLADWLREKEEAAAPAAAAAAGVVLGDDF